MIKKFDNFTTETINLQYPLVRHLSLLESAISIIENGYFMSRNEIKKNIHRINSNIIENKNLNSTDKWWEERKELENTKFGTEDIIYCIPDWFNDSGYETGHGSVMFYFKPDIYEKFKVTLTLEDSLTENRNRVYDHNEIQKIYSNILNQNNIEYRQEAKIILENLNHKNKESVFNTSKGRIFIEGNRFYNKYAEIQIHASKVPIEYIQEIRLTDNYFMVKDSDSKNKEKLIHLCKEKSIKIS